MKSDCVCNLPLFNFSLQLSCGRDEERERERRLILTEGWEESEKTCFLGGSLKGRILLLPKTGKLWQVFWEKENWAWIIMSGYAFQHALVSLVSTFVTWIVFFFFFFFFLYFLTFFPVTFFLLTLLSFHQEFRSYKTRDWSGRCILSVHVKEM